MSWLAGFVEVVSTCSRQPTLITCWDGLLNDNINDIVPLFACFQLENQIKMKKINFFFK